MTMEQQYSLPLFPLDTVLFPGMPLPLHVFEDRYKLMVNECLEERQPFGVALIRTGRQEGSEAEPHQIGTSAIITEANRLPDGRLNIVTVGYERFRILSLSRERPYLQALVEPLPPAYEETDEAYAEASRLRPELRRYVRMMGELTETKIELSEVPRVPVLLAFLTAILLQVPRADKQGLLAAATVPEMLTRERLLLLREQRLMQANIGAEFALEDGLSSFSRS